MDIKRSGLKMFVGYVFVLINIGIAVFGLLMS